MNEDFVPMANCTIINSARVIDGICYCFKCGQEMGDPVNGAHCSNCDGVIVTDDNGRIVNPKHGGTRQCDSQLKQKDD